MASPISIKCLWWGSGYSLMSIASQATSILKRDSFLYITKMVTGVIVARKLGPEILGIYVILAMIPTLAESFGRMKFDVAAVYFLGKKKYTEVETLKTLNFMALFTSGLIVSVVLFEFDWLYGLLFAESEYDASGLMVFILLQIPLHFLLMNYSYLIIQKEEVQTYNKIIIIQALVSTVLPVILLLLTDMGLWAVVGSAVLGTFLALLYGVAKYNPTGSHSKKSGFPLIRDLFRYGFKLYLAGLLGYLQAYITNIFVALYLPSAQVAFFSVSRNVGQIVERVPAALNTILFPKLTNLDDNEHAEFLTARAFRMMLVMLSLFGIVAALLIYPTIRFVYGAEYLPAVWPFLILIPSIVFSGACSTFMTYFLSINRADLGVILNLPSFTIQIVLAWVLIPWCGLQGAAISFAASLIVFSFANIWVFLKFSSCSICADLLLRREDIECLQRLVLEEANKILTFLKLKQV